MTTITITLIKELYDQYCYISKLKHRLTKVRNEKQEYKEVCSLKYESKSDDDHAGISKKVRRSTKKGNNSSMKVCQERCLRIKMELEN